MSDLGNKKIMARNIIHYMGLNGKTRHEMCEALGVKYTTFTDWVKGNTYPRIDKIELMANYFGINKSDLVEDHSNNSQEKSSVSGIYRNTIYLLGKVAAGTPIYASENIIGELDVPESWSDRNQYFGLQIAGNSMEPKISNNDIVIVHSQQYADSGDIVIALVNGDDAVCKRYMAYGNITLLRSLNSEYDDIDVTNRDDFRIIGKVIELRRKF